MKKIIAVLILCFGLVQAEPVAVKIESPGLTGMNSNADFELRQITDGSLIINCNPWATPGFLKVRFPLRSVGDNNIRVFAAFGYFDFANKMKQIVSIANGTDSLVKGFQGGVVTYNVLSTDSMAPWIRVSNRFETGVQDSQISIGGFVGAPPYNAVNFDGALFVTSKGNVPLVYYPYGATTSLPDKHQKDTAFYRPHAFSMGLEAPGQPRAGILNAAGIIFGSYRYAYRLFSDTHVVAISLPSRWITTDSQKTFVTLFEAPASVSATDTGVMKFEFLRQKFNGFWYKLDTFTMKVNQSAVYIDNAKDDSSYVASNKTVNYLDSDDPIRTVVVSNHNTPGALWVDGVNTLVAPSRAKRAVFDTVYYLAYSYYDPINGAESPMGPITKTGGAALGGICDVTFPSTPDTVLLGAKKGYTKIYERAPWIRAYRSALNDSTIWYGYAQFRANNLYPNQESGTTNYWLYPGMGHDSMVTAGFPTQKTSTDTSYRYIQNDIFQSETGTAFVRPPYVEQLEVPYTDIAYANGRFWGIGDPLFPARVYFSTYNDPYQWSALDNFDLSPNEPDELVAIEVIPEQGEDFARIVLFKHNSMYELSGYDPEFDLTWRTVSTKYGSISNRTVTRLDDAIYFLAMNMRIYRYAGGEPEEISKPIEDYIDTLFRSADTARQKCVVFAMQDKVVFSDTLNSRALVYVPSRNWWGVEQYPTDFEPIGSFQYDSLRGNFAQDQSDYWIYQGGTGEKFVAQFDYRTVGDIVDTINGSDVNITPTYRTPYVGDGNHLFQITKIDILGRWPGGLLKVRIKDGFGATLDTALINDALLGSGLAPPSRLHTLSFGVNEGSYLGVELTRGTAMERIEIHNLTVYYRRVGRPLSQ